MTTTICCNCESVILPEVHHNCFKSITENIDRLRKEVNRLSPEHKDHLDGLKYALEIINQIKQNYKHMSFYPVSMHDPDPINDIENAIRLQLGISLIPRPVS